MATKATKTAEAPATQTVITMTVDKECKGSRRYKAIDPDAPISNLYLDRSDPSCASDDLVVTIAGT